MITFFCNKNEFPVEELRAFTTRTGSRVVIRGVAVIENGKIEEFSDEKNRY
jgi:hypothetical protein